MAVRHSIIAATLACVVIAGSASLSQIAQAQAAKTQEPQVPDADVSVWISDIWEHKVILSVAWSNLPELCQSFSSRAPVLPAGCPIEVFDEMNLHQITAQRIDEDANTACSYYQRTAIGPLNIDRPDGNARIFQYMYACAIR